MIVCKKTGEHIHIPVSPYFPELSYHEGFHLFVKRLTQCFLKGACRYSTLGVIVRNKIGPSPDGKVECFITFVSRRVHPADQIEHTLLTCGYQVGNDLIEFFRCFCRQLCKCIGNDGSVCPALGHLCLKSAYNQ